MVTGFDSPRGIQSTPKVMLSGDRARCDLFPMSLSRYDAGPDRPPIACQFALSTVPLWSSDTCQHAVQHLLYHAAMVRKSWPADDRAGADSYLRY